MPYFAVSSMKCRHLFVNLVLNLSQSWSYFIILSKSPVIGPRKSSWRSWKSIRPLGTNCDCVALKWGPRKRIEAQITRWVELHFPKLWVRSWREGIEKREDENLKKRTKPAGSPPTVIHQSVITKLELTAGVRGLENLKRDGPLTRREEWARNKPRRDFFIASHKAWRIFNC